MRVSHVKRFMELFRGDPGFREAVAGGRFGVVRDWGLEVDPLALRSLWESGSSSGEPEEPDPAVAAYRAARDALRHRGHAASAELGRPGTAYASWRERQVQRNLSQTSPPLWANPHHPFAIELARGCSVGCDYCCFAAPPLSAVARFATHLELFAGVLDVLGRFFGKGAGSGFLYWATEPFDNPDYEDYQQAFHERLGAWPRTTTAAWHRSPARTRRSIALARGHGNRHGLRLSINTLEELHRCMQEFAADELEDVEVLPQNPGSSIPKYRLGRAALHHPDSVPESNCNVSGLLINLLDRSVALISPTSDLARWPLGHAVYARASFADAGELAGRLATWEREILADRLDGRFVPRLRVDMTVDSEAGRTRLSTAYARIGYEDPAARAILGAVDGRRSVDELVGALLDRHSAWELYARFRLMYRSGLFEQEPDAAPAHDGSLTAAAL